MTLGEKKKAETERNKKTAAGLRSAADSVYTQVQTGGGY